jgi:outer membrane protein assembly factor BamB
MSRCVHNICFLSLCLWAFSSNPTRAVEPWATYRGNPERTGNTDGIAGPAVPKILWALKSKDNYIAAPVPVGDKLLLSSLGGFNVGIFACVSTDPRLAPDQRTLWIKTTPFLRLPTVSSPGVFRGKIVFGDGMHQTDGASLYCLDLAKGLPMWRHPVPGNLVHLEGAPTIAGGKAYVGGGAAGVICVDVSAVTLEGKSFDLAGLEKTLELRWRELQAKYQEEKKKDPDFAIPPSEDQLPRANPKRLWQQGKDKWHVDAPVTVVDGKVLVCSSHLDAEGVGDRAVFCLDARSGAILWRRPLHLNPWGGASISGKRVIVTGSSIGYYPAALRGAKGLIAAFDLTTGAELWNKNVSGGVAGCAALADGAAVITATDGKVRAFNLTDGGSRWIYDAKVPFFAPVAIAKNTAYAADFNGILHAIDLASGSKKWSLDLGTAPETQAPGMVYGGPVVHGGRIYLATCNLEGPFARQPTVVVGIGEK